MQADVAAIAGIAAVPTILEVVRRITGMRFVAVARVTEDRWIACSVKDDIEFGLKPGDELKINTTICDEIRQSRDAVIIDHVSNDAAFRTHPTPLMYGFQSYISMPIILPDSRFFGTLCAIDPKPARLSNPETVSMFRLFAELIGYHLDALERAAAGKADLTKARSQLAVSVDSLAEERRMAHLREEFVAILGHDLRNPLGAIRSGMDLLQRTPLNRQAKDLVSMIQQSISRMSELIGNTLDFTRGRLGGGMHVERVPNAALEPALEQVVEELRACWPDRLIETRFALPDPVSCDPDRIGQLCSNLLSNALIHGSQTLPVQVAASSEGGEFQLYVSNGGRAIPAEMLQHLFEPFSHSATKSHQQGLGLGLYIAAEIARAHGGSIKVVSNDTETRFTFQMPSSPIAT
nr:GAF domain-containing sensor histidine kinase [Roseococcus sp. MDT2-1-1]